MNILVTGHQGFVGRHLVKKLEELDHTVYGIDIKEDGVFDVREEIIVASNKEKPTSITDVPMDMVIHLAANCSNPLSMKNPIWDAQTNIIGTIRVLEYCRQKKIPIIFYSTCRIYSDEEKAYDMNITDKWLTTRTIPPYGLSKRVAEDYIELYHNLWGVDYFILRPGTIYGPGQDGTEEAGWVYHFVNKALNKETITIFGDGEQSRDVLYVDDIIDFTLILMIAPKDKWNKTYDIGGGQSNVVSLNTITNFLNADVEYAPARKPDLYHYVSDMSDIIKDFGWKPRTNWITGINKIIEDIKNGKH